MTTLESSDREIGRSSIPARLDRLPIVSTHVRATVIIGIGLFFDLYEIFLSGTLSTVLASKFGLGGNGLTLLLSSAFLGMFVGATTIGRIADRIGRRHAFLMSLAIYSVFTLVAGFAPNATTLVICRFLAGIGIGAEPPVADTYLGDILPPRKRGLFTGLAYTLSFLGVPVVGFLAHWLVPTTFGGLDGWRWMFIFGAVGGIIVFALRTSLPESPRWLAATGRESEADAIVDRMEQEAARRGDLAEPDTETTAAPREGGVRELLRPPLRRRTTMMVVFHFFQSWGYFGFGTLVPTVLALRGFDIVTSLGFLAVIYIGYPVGGAVSLPLIEVVERKRMVIGTAAAMAAFGIAFGVAGGEAAILILGFCYTATSNVFSNAYHVYQAEIFPTRLRGTAGGATYSLSRLSSGLMPFILVPLLEHHGSGALFTVVALAMCIVGAIVWLLGPHSTGRTLTELNQLA